MGLKSLLGGTTLADVRKAKARAERELSVSKAAVLDADAAYDVALESGDDDEKMRAALDRKNVTSWAVARATKKLAALDAELKALEAKDRAERLKRHMLAAIETATAHGVAAEAARATAANHLRALTVLQENGFASEACAFAGFPAMILDYSTSFSTNPNIANHDALDRWRWSIVQLKKVTEALP